MKEQDKELTLQAIYNEVQTLLIPEEKISSKKFDVNKVLRKFIEEIAKEHKRQGGKEFLFDEENKAIIFFICEYLAGFHDQSKGIALIGNYGSGKSLILKAYRNFLQLHGERLNRRRCEFTESQTIIERYNEVDEYNGKHLGMLALKPYVSIDNKIERVIDDIGSEEVTVQVYGNKFSPIAYILNKRNDLNLITHITTNLSLDEISAKYGDRIESRFHSLFHILYLGASQNSIDYRKFKQSN